MSDEEPRPLEEVLGDTMGKTFDSMDAAETGDPGSDGKAAVAPEDGAGETAAATEETTEQEPEAPETAASGDETTEDKPEDQPGADAGDESLPPAGTLVAGG